MRNLAGKLFVLLGVFVVLVIAVQSVRGVLADRLQYRAEALANVGESLAGPQRVAGVVLAVPYVERWVEESVAADGARSGVERSARREHLVLPAALDVDGRLVPDERRRGLFAVTGWVWSGALRGELQMPDAAALPRTRPGSAVEIGVPRAIVAVGDVRGLRRVEIAVGGRALDVQPGTGLAGERAGVAASLGGPPAAGAKLAFAATLEIGGAGPFEIVPLGTETRAHVVSAWPHPSFGGRVLPVERRVGADGFDARWRTTAFATNARDAWVLEATGVAPESGAEAPPSPRRGPVPGLAVAPAAFAAAASDTFRIELIDPVDVYASTDRATKYALLFVALTLGAFALYDALRRLRLHPLQYLFVGAALATFFLLLLALAEHVGFAVAYLAASAACVGLLGVYVAGVLRSASRGAGFAAGVAALYAALYGIVQSEQNALLLGALLVFGLLAVAMLATRRVDWHAQLESRSGN